MSAHHVVAVDAVRGVLHAVVDLSPEHGQVLREPVDGRGGGGSSSAWDFNSLHRTTTVPSHQTSRCFTSASTSVCFRLPPLCGHGDCDVELIEQTHLSRFLVSRFLSIPSIKFSKHKCMACCFSGGWLLTMLFLRSAKYCRNETAFKDKRWEAVQIHAVFYLLVEQDETQERPGHRPLVPTVFEDDDVQHRGQHLQDRGPRHQRGLKNQTSLRL